MIFCLTFLSILKTYSKKDTEVTSNIYDGSTRLWLSQWQTKIKTHPWLCCFFLYFSSMLKFIEGTSQTLFWMTWNFLSFLHFSLFLMLLGHSHVTFPCHKFILKFFLCVFAHETIFCLRTLSFCLIYCLYAVDWQTEEDVASLICWFDSTVMCLRWIVWFLFWFCERTSALHTCVFMCLHQVWKRANSVCGDATESLSVCLSGGDWVDWSAPPWF